MAEKRDWLEITAKLLLPTVLAVGGILYTWHKDTVDRRAEQDRQSFDRDLSLVHLLASSNDKERDLGLKWIDVLGKEGRFPPDLVPIVVALSVGRADQGSSQVATTVLASAGSKDPALGARIATAVENTPTEVYIQIAREEQRPEAERLRSALQKLAFAAPGVELVASATDHTYVRYFAVNNLDKATQIDQEMKRLGFPSKIQNFANGRQTPQLEVWIGAYDPLVKNE